MKIVRNLSIQLYHQRFKHLKLKQQSGPSKAGRVCRTADLNSGTLSDQYNLSSNLGMMELRKQKTQTIRPSVTTPFRSNGSQDQMH